MQGGNELTFQPAPGLEDIYHLQALHGPREDLAHSYFIKRSRGNILVSPLLYTPEIADWMEGQGGVALAFVTHSDEVGAALRTVGRTTRGPFPERIPTCRYKETFGAQIALHSLDAPKLRECSVDLSWTEDFRFVPDVRLIHTPGDTPGSASLLVSHRGRRILFCGDFMGLDARGRIIIYWGVSSREVLKKLLALRFDALVPLHTEKGSPHPFLFSGGREALREATSALAED
ncbi:MAG: MBL fold metallo-hydrolase [Candidatus Geothermarchaeales archaeon]